MPTTINVQVGLAVLILLLILLAAGYVIIIFLRYRRRERLLKVGADPEFIELVNDRYAFCDSEDEYRALLEREADDPPHPIVDNLAAASGERNTL